MTEAETFALLQEAVTLHRQGALAEAIPRYQRVLQANPANYDALYLLGTAALQGDRAADALALLQQALAGRPDWAAAHHMAGLAQMQLWRFDGALESFERAVALEPGALPFLVARANALSELARFEEAARAYGEIVAVAPDMADAWHNQSYALLQLNNAEAALASVERALALQPEAPHLELQRADCLRTLGRTGAALEAYERLLKRDNAPIMTQVGRALALAALGRTEEALRACDEALLARPFSADALVARGGILLALGSPADALASFDQALQTTPNHPMGLVMRGAALHALDRLPEALAAFEAAQARMPQSAKVLADRAFVLNTLGRFDEAFAAIGQALSVAPDEPEICTTAGLIELVHGRWQEGWQHYESRRDVRTLAGTVKLPPLRYPRWQGEEIGDGLLLLVSEPGLGDAIQAARFAPVLAAKGLCVAVLTSPTLAPFFGSLRGVERVIITEDELKDETRAIHWLPMMSAARILGVTAETVPHEVPYLAVDKMRIADWHEKIASRGFKIGIAWQGNPQYPYDHGRSIPLSAFAPLADIPGVRLISLQKSPGDDQVSSVAFGRKIEVHTRPADQRGNALFDTAAIMMNLDLVVTSDTMAAHLAGALGRPVFVALRRVPDWRWLLEREDSPWYPTMRLFRQSRDGDGAGVFARIAAAARERAEAANA